MGRLEPEFEEVYRGVSKLGLSPVDLGPDKYANQLIAPSMLNIKYCVWTNPTNPNDTYRYRDGQGYPEAGMVMQHDKRWKSHQAPEDISPLDAIFLPSDGTGAVNIVGTDHLLANTNDLPVKYERINGAIKPAPYDGTGDFVSILNKTVAYMGVSGVTIHNWKSAIRNFLVVERLLWTLDECFANPVFVGYCYLIGDDEFCLRISFNRWMVCLVLHFEPQDADGSAVNALIERLVAPVEGDHYDVHNLWFESDRLTGMLMHFNGTKTAAKAAKIVEVFGDGLTRTNPALHSEWKAMYLLRLQTQSGKVGKTKYETYMDMLLQLRRNKIHMQTPVKKSKAIAAAVSNQVVVYDPITPTSLSQYTQDLDVPIQHQGYQNHGGRGGYVRGSGGGRGSAPPGMLPDTPRTTKEDGYVACNGCGQDMRVRANEDWHAYITKSSSKKIYPRCRFVYDRENVFEVNFTALYKSNEADINRFFESSRRHGLLSTLPEAEVKALREKVMARRSA